MVAHAATTHAATLELMDHRGRLQRLQAALPDNKLEFLLITHLPNVRYLCGFTGSAAALLVGERGATLFTDGRYIAQAKAEVRNAGIAIGKEAPAIAAAEWLVGNPTHRKRRDEWSTQERRSAVARFLGIEPESLTAGMRDRVAAALRGKMRVRSAPPLLDRARMVKDATEIERIRAAVELGASLFRIAREQIRPGASEVEVAAAMEYEARRQGADGMSFPTFLASGPRSAVVHGRASRARIPRRGFVVCDFGVILAGYCSDRTRTVHAGPPSKEARELYAAVLEAQQSAIAAVRPGVTAGDVDEAARSVLRKRKLDRYFTHSTGHGLGLEIHEAPRLAARQAQKLEPGMVVTVEPGVYIPDRWGVRIEDVVVVTSSGCEVLAATEKELVVI